MNKQKKQIIANKILQIEENHNGWLLNLYKKDNNSFMSDLMKQDFNKLLKYYRNCYKSLDKKAFNKNRNYLEEAIEVLCKELQ
ncbi:MAG: hypothetical protein ACOCRK_07440 [bacterium]